MYFRSLKRSWDTVYSLLCFPYNCSSYNNGRKQMARKITQYCTGETFLRLYRNYNNDIWLREYSWIILLNRAGLFGQLPTQFSFVYDLLAYLGMFLLEERVSRVGRRKQWRRWVKWGFLRLCLVFFLGILNKKISNIKYFTKNISYEILTLSINNLIEKYPENDFKTVICKTNRRHQEIYQSRLLEVYSKSLLFRIH